MRFFEKLKDSLSKTKHEITDRLNEVIKKFKIIDEDFFDELEEILITSDLGFDTSEFILDNLRKKAKEDKIKDSKELISILKQNLKDILKSADHIKIFDKEDKKKVLLVVGVNGVGKTTSIGKIANLYRNKEINCVIAAADTFRAGAIDQLQIWADRANVKMIRQNEGSDPSAVIFDAISYAKKHDSEVLICDTAGRLHNKKNLMNELEKIYRTIRKNYSEAKVYTMLVIDASTGQNGVSQAKLFKEVVDVDGIILTKIDGTAKGGIVFSISNELNIPVKFIGVGEKIDDLEAFIADDFVNALFDS